MKLYLDDLRNPPDDSWTVVRTVEEAKDYLQQGVVEVLSLDHDLGTYGDSNEDRTGYEVVKWLEEEVNHRRLIPPAEFKIHSANPVGRANMEAAIASIIRLARRNEENL